jgi:hypothetical protein
MKLIKVIKNYKPLFIDENILIISKYDTLFFMDITNFQKEKLITLPNSLIKKIFQSNKYFFRLLRCGVRSALKLNCEVFINHNNCIYRYNILEKKLYKEMIINNGHGPLTLIYIEEILSFDKTIYFGEYFNNPGKECVKIYKRNLRNFKWEVVYEFPRGSINHIHALIPDKYNDCVWILTGDCDKASGIWMAINNFKKVQPIFIGLQQYRSCVAFPTPEGLLYATDSQFGKNTINFIHICKNSYFIEKLYKINGSCIYGCKVRKYFVFSTSTEPYFPESKYFLNILSRKSGPGINRNESDIILLDEDMNMRIVSSNAKDFLPYILFQFGTVMFPNGKNDTNILYSYSIANKINDLSLEIRDLSAV